MLAIWQENLFGDVLKEQTTLYYPKLPTLEYIIP